MNDKDRCGMGSETVEDNGYEVARIEKTKFSCHLCEDYAERRKDRPVAVMSCEGACLRGEVARQAANILCHSLLPEKTTRICLGGAFTKDTGQRKLVRNAKRLIALEGCPINCASRMMKGVINGLEPEVINADQLYEFDKNLFGIDEMAPEQIFAHAQTVARKIVSCPKLNL
jgi:uncharacterized metal-binding protein